MAAAAMTSIPLVVGGTIFSVIGKGILWAVVATFRAPITTSLILSMTIGTVLAATNALYMQPVTHPAPMFSDSTMVTSSLPAAQEPVPVKTTPVEKPQKPIVKQIATPKVAPQPIVTAPAPVPAIPAAVAKIDHASVKAMQLKLVELGHYEGDADGYYGPKTASAIREFELKTGRTPVGALTPELLNAVALAKKLQTAQPTASKPALAPVQPKASVPAASVAEGQAQPNVLSEPVAELEQQIPQAIKTDPLMSIVQKVASTTQSALQRDEEPASNKYYIERVQRGLASLGFLRGKIDGVAGAETAKAIRNFEVYYNYKVSGKVTPELVDLLAQAGAQI